MTPAFQHALQRRQGLRIVVHQQHPRLPRARRGRRMQCSGIVGCGMSQYLQSESCALSDPSVQAHGRLQQIGNALGNRQSEPQPLSACAIATPEFLERALLRRCRNTRTCVEHVHPPAAIDPAHAQQHTAAFGVAHRIGQQVLQHASQQLRVGMRPRTSGAVAEAQAALGRQLDVLHRVASMASGGMDTLPHNGAVITLLAVTGLAHRQSYKDIFAITLIKTLAVFVIIGVFYATGMV